MTLPKEKTINVYDNLSKNTTTTRENNASKAVTFCDKTVSAKALFFDKYASRAFDILKSSSSLLITGGKGVGKTTLVNHLQFLIDTYNCPKSFYDSKIYMLSQIALGYGVRFTAEYEEHLVIMINDMVNLLSKGENPILFIDNLPELICNNINVNTHMYIEQAINAGISVIACCDTNDMKLLESKYDLIRHFTEIQIKEPTMDETKEIVKNEAFALSQMYRIDVSHDLCEKTVSLSDKYIKNKFCMPQKAIRVLEIALGKRANALSLPNEDTKNKIKKIPELQNEIQTIIKNSKNPDCKTSLSNLLSKNNELNDLKQFIKTDVNFIKASDAILTDDDIYAVVSDLAGVPVTKLSESDTSKLKEMVPTLMSKVIGQDEAINKVCKTVKRNRLGLRKKNHTIGNFMFIGSTGVGKTFLAKKLAEYMFGSKDTIIRLDMSEYTDEISVNKLIGAPPGYVGYGEGGVLCNAIKSNPYSVILFDEIEKAHPTIYNTILQLMDEGRITDSNGNRISATNTIIILTSNIGVKEAVNAAQSVGFSASKEDSDRKNSENKKNTIVKAMNKLFAPEFLGRLDAVCYFNDLNNDNMSKIFDNEFSEVLESVKELGYELEVSADVKKFIVEKSEKEKLGARALIKNIQQDIVDEMTELIIESEKQNSKVSVMLDKSKENIKIKLS